MYEMREFIAAVRDIIAGHQKQGSPGEYRRWNWQNAAQNRELDINPYGCADAANILYTIGYFPENPHERSLWVAALRKLQDPQSGFFYETTHHEIHTTAHCIAALELFDASPEYPLTGLALYRDAAEMELFLQQLDWRNDPWRESHKGAGLYAAMVLAREVPKEWQDRYFSWLSDQTDPKTGFIRNECVYPVGTPSGHLPSLFPHLAGTFHYLFNQEYARQPLRYPEAMIDTCLGIFRERCFPLGNSIGFAEIDWVFCITRSLRQCGYRHADCLAALTDFTAQYIPFLLGLDSKTDDGMNDLHALFGTLCCLAELQIALPGQIKTERPLKLVLDRRPFI